MTIVTRFAPSPTGRLHVGNIRTALHNWLWARKQGRRPHWRFRLDHDAPITWQDLIRGPQHLEPALLSDPVVRREDGTWLYMLPSVVDDVEMGVTHVVRGEDHVTNTGLQLQMFAAL